MNLVFSQSTSATVIQREFEEELVAALVMQDRIDVSLVGDIADMEDGSTDALCIEGVRGDMLCASWHAVDAALHFLSRMSVVGRTGPSAPRNSMTLPVITTSGQYDPMQRRIECLNLTGYTSVQAARKAILSILSGDPHESTPVTRSDACDPEFAPDKPNNLSPVKAMPPRSGTKQPADELDSLLDEFDEADV